MAGLRILATGTEGYIGVLLPSVLAARGHEVVGLDTGFYRSGWLYHLNGRTPPTLHRDVRQVKREDVDGFDAVVHLAELSNDPVGQLDPDITYEINHRGALHLAETARDAGVKRFVYASSCSVYGVAEQDLVDEESPVNPQTAYAECKVLVERDLAMLAADDFSPTFLRNATAYGASPRMRFDIVLNNLCGLAWTIGEIRMESDGTPWRPFVHALDICKAIACSLEAPRETVHGEVLNVGDSRSNYQIRDVAEIVKGAFPECRITFSEDAGPDNRSYRVSFDKIGRVLPDFSCDWTLDRGARQLRQLYERIGLTDDMFRSRHHTRLKQIQYLRETGQLDPKFFWTVPCDS
jgi:nucleoside-diphosphate-sugar epimerase